MTSADIAQPWTSTTGSVEHDLRIRFEASVEAELGGITGDVLGTLSSVPGARGAGFDAPRVNALLETLEMEGRRILVDCGPDLRQQLLAAEVGRLDGVIVTHAHGEHACGGRVLYDGKDIGGLDAQALRAVEQELDGLADLLRARGDGVTTAYQWVWIPNPPSAPAAAPPAPSP